LRLNDQPITILDISSLIMVVEEKDSNPYGVFKCYFNNATKEFYIAINELTPIKVFTRSILLNMFDFAEKQGAKTVYACLRKSAIEIGFYFVIYCNVVNLAQYAQSFLFVGFEYVNEENEEENSNDTHIILKINIAKDGEKKHLPDSDDDLFG
jgi:hypothetical protein